MMDVIGLKQLTLALAFWRVMSEWLQNNYHLIWEKMDILIIFPSLLVR